MVPAKIIFSFALLLANLVNKSACEQYEFDYPDIVFTSDSLTLEAFSSLANKDIFTNKRTEDYNRLKWNSLGNARLVDIATLPVDENSTGKYFDWSEAGFYAHIATLEPSHVTAIKHSINRKYKIDVESDQIELLIPTDFECSFNLQCVNKATTKSPSRVHFKGAVTYMLESPLRLEFEFTPETRPYKECVREKLFEGRSSSKIPIKCDIYIKTEAKDSARIATKFKRSISLYAPNSSSIATRQISEEVQQLKHGSLEFNSNFF